MGFGDSKEADFEDLAKECPILMPYNIKKHSENS